MSPPEVHSSHGDRVIDTVTQANAGATSTVAASWSRSFHLYNLNPEIAPIARICAANELMQLRDRSGRLVKVASPIVDRLFATLRLSGCSVVLCDPDGVILETRQNSGDVSDFEKVGLNQGSNWSEAVQGTNGIGTCLAEHRPTTILKDQHFMSNHIGMSCFGVPIMNSVGQVIAVLDVSTCRDNMDPGINALIAHAVTDAAKQMETEYFCDEFSDMRILHGPSGSDRMTSLLAVDAFDIVVGASRMARRYYGLPLSDKLLPMSASDLVGDTILRGTGLESAERREIQRALTKAKGNMSAAARLLGISRATMYRRAAKLDLLHDSASDLSQD